MNLAVAVLRRDDSAEEVKFADDSRELAKQVQSQLGYRRFSDQIHHDDLKLSTLRDLASLEIKPFTQQSVGRYKKAVFIKHHKNPLVVLQRFQGAAMQYLFWVLLIASLACLGSVVYSWWSPAFNYGVQSFGAAVVLFACSMILDGRKFNSVVCDWQTRDFRNYDGEIPRFVMQTALAVKAKMPDAEVLIEEFCQSHEEHQVYPLREKMAEEADKHRRRVEERRRERFRALDPFLVIRRNGLVYYLEVWDEPNFHGERMV